MATRSQKVKLGVFLLVSAALFVLSLVVLTGMEMWEDQDRYYIEFSESVSGLEIGAPVKLRGVDVGSVIDIRLEPENVEVVKVFISVIKGTPIKSDTKAFINMQGITGLKFIELAEGTAQARTLEPGSRIAAGRTMLEQLTGRASDIGVKVEKVLNNVLYITRPANRDRIDAILEGTEEAVGNLNTLSEDSRATLAQARSLVRETRRPLAALLEAATQTVQLADATLIDITATSSQGRDAIRAMKLGETVAGVRQTNEMVQAQLESLALGGTLDRISQALETFRVLLAEVTETLSQNQDQFRATLYNLRMASESLKEFSRALESKPSRLIFDEDPPARKR